MWFIQANWPYWIKKYSKCYKINCCYRFDLLIVYFISYHTTDKIHIECVVWFSNIKRVSWTWNSVDATFDPKKFPNMAELAGFRRYSYPALRHKPNQVQRGSLFSVATTNQSSGHSWLFILRAMRKQELSFSAGSFKYIFIVQSD